MGFTVWNFVLSMQPSTAHSCWPLRTYMTTRSSPTKRPIRRTENSGLELNALSLEKGPRNVVRPYCAEYEFPYLDVHDGAKQFFFFFVDVGVVVTLMIYRRCNTFTRTAMPMSTVGDKATEPSHRQSNASKNFTNTFGQQPERITDSNLCK